MLRTLLLMTLIAAASTWSACSDDTSSGVGSTDAGADTGSPGADGGEDAGVADTAAATDTAATTDTAAPDTDDPQDTNTPMDTGAADTGAPQDTGGPMDTGAPMDGGDDGGTEVCAFSAQGPADRDRVVLIGQSFSDTVGESGTEVRSMTLTAEGELLDNGVRVDIGVPPHRLEMTPSGEIALVLSDEGVLVSLQLKDASDVGVVDALELPSAGYGDLIMADGGTRAIVVGNNSTADGGVNTVRVACDGTLTLDEAAFFPLRLAQSLAPIPGTDRALLLGGQAVFEPVDDNDVRLVEWTGSGWIEVAAYDIFGDFVNTDRIAFSGATNTLLIANSSPFSAEGNQMSVLQLEGDALTETERLMGINDPYETAFSPDGQIGLVTLFQPGRLIAYAQRDQGLVEVGSASGIGLAAQMAFVRRGSLAGTVLITSTDPSGAPNIAMLQIAPSGEVTDLGQTDFGDASSNIPDGITITP